MDGQSHCGAFDVGKSLPALSQCRVKAMLVGRNMVAAFFNSYSVVIESQSTGECISFVSYDVGKSTPAWSQCRVKPFPLTHWLTNFIRSIVPNPMYNAM